MGTTRISTAGAICSIAILFTLANPAHSAETIAAARIAFKADGQTVRMLAAPAGRTLTAPLGNTPRAAADKALDLYAVRFGIKDPNQQLALERQHVATKGRTSLRYQQVVDGVPVLGGELIVSLSADRALKSLNGETSPAAYKVSTTAAIPAVDAKKQAREAVSKWYRRSQSALNVSNPELAVYDPHLIGPGNAPAGLVWKMEVSDSGELAIRELVLVDAVRGGIRLHIDQIDRALDRKTYTANGTSTTPGSLVCDESQPNCTNGSDVDADLAHKYAKDTYDFYLSHHGRDSIDGHGMTIVSTVDWYDTGGCPNATWTGTQMRYCNGAPQADDVVGHELTHGVTQHESGLHYYYQSGAINESLSDVWGEFIDLTNGAGTDTAAVRWKMGEDFPGLGVIRDMADPPAYGDPDKMTSAHYYTGSSDNGGVHENSGINNKAAYLITDGDTFNGKTVAGLGITKAAAIYYEVQTNLLTSGSDYGDLHDYLYQGCLNIVGQDGITASDCNQVRDATDAVEMDQQPVAGFNPDPPMCPSGKIVNPLYSQDMEGTVDLTSVDLSGTNNPWSIASDYATSGTKSAIASDISSVSDSALTQMTATTLPPGAYMHFRHAYGLESDSTNFYDGGAVEYSLNGGATWSDAAALFDTGKNYDGPISSSYGNPIGGRNAFSGNSHGYVSTRYDLNSLVGHKIRFRFRLATDSGVASQWWVVDDIGIYVCASTTDPTAWAGLDKTVAANAASALDGSASTDDVGITQYTWTQTGGSAASLSGANTAQPTFTAPARDATLTFQLQVTDGDSNTDTDTVVVTVTNSTPTADAGADKTVSAGDAVSLDATGSTDAESAVSYSWTQTGGSTVTLNNANSATPSFTAPATADTLTFKVDVSDTGGKTASDSVAVNVTGSSSNSSGGGGGGGGSIGPLWLLGCLIALGLRRGRPVQS